MDSLADRRAADPYVDDLTSYLPNEEGSVYECEESVEDRAREEEESVGRIVSGTCSEAWA